MAANRNSTTNIIDNKNNFLRELNKFMAKRNTPIQRVPNMGFKKSKYEPYR